MKTLELPALVRSDSLARQAYHALRRAIRDGDIAPEQFFSENEIAASMGVSRTPVREALLDLFREGLVEILPKRGFRLARIDDAAIDEVRVLRAALERLVVERLCARATSDDIRALAHELDSQRRMHDPEREMFAADERFHSLMAQRAGLPQTAAVLLAVRGKMYLMARGAKVTKLRTEAVLHEHETIVRAIDERNAAAAIAAIDDHVSRSISAFEAARATREIGA